ncbi:N-acetyltransferase [Azospirillum sp. RWY-5-1]|uniref:N-acetyltransferase n=1 Tax=Azospirillum oleiclasticum TaxID=2735135 RepID=A0ABX2TC55_9PROT|nr:GNAT family N-acetyltransferase [Azospirillum oleiclasticum]NYZ13573.1 N-acetyltransferase [Azospirillum oleiclasticum]NYZ20733.1 N-acetyltransferase [Azospirillum oleiclasticum]
MTLIRNAEDQDLDAILAIYNDAVVNTTAVYDYEPRNAEAQARWFAAKREQCLPVIVAEIGGAVAGFASFGPFRPWPAYLHTVENSVYIAPDRRGQGVGSALIPPLLDLARAKGLHTMVAGIDATNEASLRLHRKFGFEPVGLFKEVGWKFGRWLDLAFLQRML